MNRVAEIQGLMVHLVDAFGKGDIPTVQSLIAEDAVWHVLGGSSIAGAWELVFDQAAWDSFFR